MEFWEAKFKEIGTMWKFEPSNSALMAIDFFKAKKINNILIPGVGYGRNAKLFCDDGFKVTGIEISQTAISLARENGMDFKIHHGSVLSMPLDNTIYEGIFCYAMLHLLNKKERLTFLKSCYSQLQRKGIMIFIVVSTKANIYGKGRRLSKDRFVMAKGLNVFFYDAASIVREFSDFGLAEYKDIVEPIKYTEGEEPLNCIYVMCEKK
jgi:hypothetical protein